jgi:hypothetical protein
MAIRRFNLKYLKICCFCLGSFILVYLCLGLPQGILILNEGSPKQLVLADNFAKLGRAFAAYHDSHGLFPEEYIKDSNWTPVLSWRVSILPALGEQELYRQFRLDEPWDSAHNKALVNKMPRVFANPYDDMEITSQGKTSLVGASGQNTFFDNSSRSKASFIERVRKGDLIMLLETSVPVPWTEPIRIDLSSEPDISKLGSKRPRGFHALFVDGHSEFLEMKDPKIPSYLFID